MTSTLAGATGTPTLVLSVSAHPNPFNPATTLRYTLPARSHVVLVVYDLHGTRVATLVDGDRDAGEFTAAWEGRNDRGEPVTSGVYFARLVTESGQRSYKLTLIK